MRPEANPCETDDVPREPGRQPVEPRPAPAQDVRTETAGEMTRHEAGETATITEPPD